MPMIPSFSRRQSMQEEMEAAYMSDLTYLTNATTLGPMTSLPHQHRGGAPGRQHELAQYYKSEFPKPRKDTDNIHDQ